MLKPATRLRRLFPIHWQRICSSKPLGRGNEQIKRHSDVLAIFPNDAAVLPARRAVLLESTMNDKPLAGPYFSQALDAAAASYPRSMTPPHRGDNAHRPQCQMANEISPEAS